MPLVLEWLMARHLTVMTGLALLGAYLANPRTSRKHGVDVSHLLVGQATRGLPHSLRVNGGSLLDEHPSGQVATRPSSTACADFFITDPRGKGEIRTASVYPADR